MPAPVYSFLAAPFVGLAVHFSDHGDGSLALLLIAGPLLVLAGVVGAADLL